MNCDSGRIDLARLSGTITEEHQVHDKKHFYEMTE